LNLFSNNIFSRIGFLALLLFVLSSLTTPLVGQSTDYFQHLHDSRFNHDSDVDPSHLSIIDFITHLYRENTISKDEAFKDILLYLSDEKSLDVLQRKYTNFSKNNVLLNIEHANTKCLTPFVLEFEDEIMSSNVARDLLGISDLNEVNGIEKRMGDQPVTQSFEFTSESGRFVISFDTTGTTAVPKLDTNNSGIPDYVELTALYADSSWNHLVQHLGFRDPLSHSAPIRIRYINSSGVYGYATFSSNSIFLHRNFESGFPPNLDDNLVYGALKVTIAHELKHLIQFATTSVSSQPLYNWIELDATMAEEVVFPTVKDYINYLRNNSIFTHPQLSIPKTLSYQQVTFGLYFRERFGDAFWVNVWDRLSNTGSRSMFKEMDNELLSYNLSLDEEIVKSYLWHFASGARTRPGYGFKDSELYPGVRSESPSGLPLPVSTSYTTVNKRGAKYFLFSPGSDQAEKIVSGLFRENPQVHLGVIGFFNDKSNDTGMITRPIAGVESENLPFNFDGMFLDWPINDLEAVGVVVVNNSDTDRMSQIITGTESSPSTVKYGDINQDGLTTIMDGELILYHLVGLPSAPDLNSPLSRLTADLSGDGTASIYDASLILKYENNIIDTYPVDIQKELFVPRFSWFRPAKSDPVFTKSKPDPDYISLDPTNPPIRFTSTVSNLPDDDKLRVMVHLDDTTSIYSAFIELDYDDKLLSYAGFNTLFIEDNQEISQFQTTNRKLKLAIARSTPLASDPLFEIVFTPLADTNVTVILKEIHLDEKVKKSTSLQITADVTKSGGVGIPKPSEIPHFSRLLNNYPNPFNPTTTIPFELPASRIVKIQVLDVTGRVVRTLTDEVYSGGFYQLIFNATNLSSGVYFVRMISSDHYGDGPPEQSIKRILLIK
jgi:hypothetical protein